MFYTSRSITEQSLVITNDCWLPTSLSIHSLYSRKEIIMQQLTPNVYSETEIRGCDPSIVITREGAVLIDTAQWITNIEKMIAFATEKAGSNNPCKPSSHSTVRKRHRWKSWRARNVTDGSEWRLTPSRRSSGWPLS